MRRGHSTTQVRPAHEPVHMSSRDNQSRDRSGTCKHLGTKPGHSLQKSTGQIRSNSNDGQDTHLKSDTNNHNARRLWSALCYQGRRAHRRVYRWGWLWGLAVSAVFASDGGATYMVLNLRGSKSLGQDFNLRVKTQGAAPWSKRLMEFRLSFFDSCLT